ELKRIESPHIITIRGKGLLNAVIINPPDENAAWKLCMELKENGLLAKPTHGDKIRFAPPLIITKEELKECIKIIEKSLKVLD
ncbi:MAG: aminotransferase class III-fold pyridoxal phosphate-dependent enzyme, partial [Ginsengibacter sp.]